MYVWLRSLKGRIVVYLYPVVTLGAIELIIRILASTKSFEAFIGPTLAALGVSFVLPLTIKKPRTKEQQIAKLRKKQGRIPANLINILEEIINNEDELGKGGIAIQLNEDSNLILYGWLFTTCVLTPIWVYTLYLSIKSPDNLLWIFPSSCYPGLFNYLVGFALSELREVI